MTNAFPLKTAPVRFLTDQSIDIGQLDEFLGLATVGPLRFVYFKEHFQPPGPDELYCSFEVTQLMIPRDVSYLSYEWREQAPPGQKILVHHTYEHGLNEHFRHLLLANIRPAEVPVIDNPMHCLHGCDLLAEQDQLTKITGNINCVWALGRGGSKPGDWLHRPILFQLQGETAAYAWPGEDEQKAIDRYLLPTLNTDGSVTHLAIQRSPAERERILTQVMNSDLIGINNRLYYDDERGIYFGRAEEANFARVPDPVNVNGTPQPQ